MTHQEIDTLLNRFLSAQTTEAEEQMLADYFQSTESVPEEWQPYRELFLSFGSSDYDLTDEELAALTAEPAPTKRKVRPLYWLGAAAAVAAILLVIGSTMLRNEATHQTIAKTDTQEQSTDTITTENGDTPTDSERKPVAKTTANQIAEAKFASKPTDTYTPPAETDISPAIGTEVATEQAVANDEPHIAQAETETAVPEIETKDDNLHFAAYSETDLPIINPQNMLYTEEDIRKIQALQKQALIAEAQQAIEITNYNLKQVEILLAQK
ncbi:MAG: hypothetical protein IJ832_05380 [Bacteroidaceae bacterium]|nr:hypothetical protein [Bacteroidaceae bacterium]